MTASKIPFLTFIPKSHLHTFRDSHFCLHPSEHFGIFQAVRFCTKAIILSILEMVLTAIIIYSTNLSRVLCVCACVYVLCLDVTVTAVESYQIHIAVSVPNVFSFHIFSAVFLPLSNHRWHRWMLSYRCFQAQGLSQLQHTQKTLTTQTGSIQQTPPVLPFFGCFAMFPEQLMLLIRHELGN